MPRSEPDRHPDLGVDENRGEADRFRLEEQLLENLGRVRAGESQLVVPEVEAAHFSHQRDPSAHAQARAADAVCIADEVQVGFGRVGRAFWGFELGDVVPDIVTLGKPIGNGHPVGAVVTTPAIARSFETGMEYFNTFGGNPVSCAAALAVLDVIADERLQVRAQRLGARIKAGIDDPAAVDVRGEGLFIGIELPDAEEATARVERARRGGVLLSTDGPRRNVIKIKPPLVLSDADVDRFLRALQRP
jgi:4-aminobutyrate aminotransferase-like enzyme